MLTTRNSAKGLDMNAKKRDQNNTQEEADIRMESALRGPSEGGHKSYKDSKIAKDRSKRDLFKAGTKSNKPTVLNKRKPCR